MRVSRMLALCVSILAIELCGGCNGAAVRAGSPPAALSPLVGTWEGKSDMKDKGLGSLANSLAGGPLTGPSSLTLNQDGTGFLKVAETGEKPIAWRQEGSRVILEPRTLQSNGDSKSAVETWVATLSGDGKTMTVDMPQVKVTLSQSR